MRTVIFIIVTVLFNTVFCQDIINLKDGNEIYSKVEKISEDVVEYRKFSNLEGPLYTKKKDQILNIKFENGVIERFADFNESINKPKPKIERVNRLEVSPPEIDSNKLAEVYSMNGLDVYFLNSPIIKYEIVGFAGDFISDIELKNIFSNRSNIRNRMNLLTITAYRSAEEKKEKIDGIIYNDGGNSILIKYLVEDSSKKKKAIVDIISELPVYVLCEPYKRKYEIVSEIEFKSGSATSFFTLGLVNSAMRDDVEILAEYFNSNKKLRKKTDAVIYLEGKLGAGIKFYSKEISK